MVSFTFGETSALLLLIGIPIIAAVHFLSLKYSKTRALMFANFDAVKRVTGNDRSQIGNYAKLTNRITLLIIRLLAYGLIVLSMAQTTIWVQGFSANQDFVIAIDSSSSMLARDISPTRFDAAKQAAIDFIDKIKGKSEIGVVSFSGDAFVEQRLTSDYFNAKQSIRNLEIKPLSGTDIAAAIVQSTDLLSVSNTSRSIILITDGRQTTGTDMSQAIDYAKKNGVKINTIGIGTQAGGTFIRDTNLVSTIDNQSLSKIANETGGKSYIISQSQDFSNAFSQIIGNSIGLIPYRMQNYFIITAILLLFTEWGLINTKFKDLP